RTNNPVIDTSVTSAAAIAQIFREEGGRVLATLIRLLGDFDLAEEAMQEAFAAALRQWPSKSCPANPRAWLVSVGRHKAIDSLRRNITLRERGRELLEDAEIDRIEPPPEDQGTLDDDMLRLVF